MKAYSIQQWHNLSAEKDILPDIFVNFTFYIFKLNGFIFEPFEKLSLLWNKRYMKDAM